MRACGGGSPAKRRFAAIPDATLTRRASINLPARLENAAPFSLFCDLKSWYIFPLSNVISCVKVLFCKRLPAWQHCLGAGLVLFLLRER